MITSILLTMARDYTKDRRGKAKDGTCYADSRFLTRRGHLCCRRRHWIPDSRIGKSCSLQGQDETRERIWRFSSTIRELYYRGEQRFWLDRSGKRWSAGSTMPRNICKGCRDAGRTCKFTGEFILHFMLA